MATITPTPYILRDMLVTIGSDEYAAAIDQLTITPKTSPQVFQGGRPSAKFVDLPDPEWDVAIQYAQDNAATSFTRYLHANQGKVVDMTFQPKAGTLSAANPAVKCKVMILPGTLGGTIGQHAKSSVTLPAIDQPAFVTA